MSKTKTKKIILFILEGQSDKQSLDVLLEEYLNQFRLKYKIVNGDITTRNHIGPNEAIRAIKACIDEVVEGRIIKKDDIERVVHIIDMDGAFISDDLIMYDEMANCFQYETTCIRSENVDKVKIRNEQKQKVVRKLVGTKSITKSEYGKSISIPYQIYYFSCNLEHVLHNLINAEEADKMNLASDFVEKYMENNKAFVSFICDSEFSVHGTYQESWEFIMKDDNSLNRYTNLCVLFEEYNKLEENIRVG